MTAETYDDLKQYVGSKNSFTDDLLNMGYTKGKKDGYKQAIDDFSGMLIRYVDCGHLCSPTEMRWSDLSVAEMVKKLAEQLKAGGKNE